MAKGASAQPSLFMLIRVGGVTTSEAGTFSTFTLPLSLQFVRVASRTDGLVAVARSVPLVADGGNLSVRESRLGQTPLVAYAQRKRPGW